MRVLLLFLGFVAYGQVWFPGGADSVVSFVAGSGQNIGQDSTYFPANVLGLPAANASATSPASSPDDICSLGLGGEIVLTFKDKILLDGPGYDFTVFENAFYINGDTNNVFGEPAVVSVSKDGINFIDFPIDTLTLDGCAGMIPTKDPLHPFDPSVSGGTPYDLSVLGIDSIKYIKIKDFTYYVLNNPSHPYYSPILSGFDLDAVVGIHLVKSTVSSVERKDLHISWTVYSGNLLLKNIPEGDYIIEVFDILGNLVISEKSQNRNKIEVNISHLPSGVYVVKLYSTKNDFWEIIKFSL